MTQTSLQNYQIKNPTPEQIMFMENCFSCPNCKRISSSSVQKINEDSMIIEQPYCEHCGFASFYTYLWPIQ